MPKTNLYQTTQFNAYPPIQRQFILQSRERIINLRLHAQKIGIHQQKQADYYWDLSVQEEEKLKNWLHTNPPPNPIQENTSSFKSSSSNSFRKILHLFHSKYLPI